MSLKRMLNKSNLVILGLNSGTSADGLDMAVVRVSRDKGTPHIKYLGGRGKPYPADLQKLILSMADSERIDVQTLIHLDNLLGQFFGQAAAPYLGRLARANTKVNMIASHGQTVRHLPDKVRYGRFTVSGSLQLGSIDQIAATTKKPVVGDFRQADIAGGGEGAPITVGAMQRIFAQSDEPRLLINLGGMANYFYLPSKKSRQPAGAIDCGPGNSLSDTLSQELFNEKYDRNGRRAARGTVSSGLLDQLLADRFFSDKRASTGRETFGSDMARQMVAYGQQFRLSGEDLLATAVELTATAITRKVQPLMRKKKNLTSLYLTGGGRKNKFLVKRLKLMLPHVTICQGDELGIDADFIEAAAYAVMGEACLRSEPINVGTKNKTGVACVLGRVAQPPVAEKHRINQRIQL